MDWMAASRAAMTKWWMAGRTGHGVCYRLRPPARVALEVDAFERTLRLLDLELVERRHIGLGGSDEGVGIGTLGRHLFALGFVLEPHRHLGLGIGAFGHRMH